MARSQETASAFPGTGVVADLTDASRMREVVADAAPFDLAVNAVSPKGRFGGGDLTTTDDDAMAPYLEQLLPEVFAFYRTCGAALGRARQRHARAGHGRVGPPGASRPGAVGGRRRRRPAPSARRPRTS